MKDKHPMQPVVVAGDGIVRFKKNEIVAFLLDHGRFDMNVIARMTFADEDREQFAQLIGYSVSGFGDLPYASRKAVRNADRRADALLASTAPRGAAKE